MSNFALKFPKLHSKQQNNSYEKNLFLSSTQLSVRSDTNVLTKPLNTTPTQRSVFFDETNNSFKSQRNFSFVPQNTKETQSVTFESMIEQISEDSNVLKTKVVEELERIETFKAMTELQINQQIEDIKTLKAKNEDLENKLMATRNLLRENSELSLKLNDYKKELERSRLSVKQLTKKCEQLEKDKQLVNHKLQKLTLSSMRPITSSPNLVSTPKFMSQIESTRISSNRSTTSFVKPLDLSPKLKSDEDITLSAKQELKENMKLRGSQSSQTHYKSGPVCSQKEIKTKIKSDKQEMAPKRRKTFKSKKQIENKKEVLKQTEGSKHRFDSVVKIDMNSIDKQMISDTDIDEYDIENVDNFKPLRKKLRTKPLKTYGKEDIYLKNIKKGEPKSPNGSELSWLDF